MPGSDPIASTPIAGSGEEPDIYDTPTVWDYYMPRPLITLTVGVETKRYSTETLFVPTAGQVGVAQVGESQVGG